MLFSSTVFAYDLDLKSLSDEEIKQLKIDVENEMSERGLAEEEVEDVLVPGAYVFGEDILAGKYELSLVDDGRDALNMFTYNSVDDYEADNVLDVLYLKAGEPKVYEFTDGQVFRFSKGQIKIKLPKKLAFAP